MTMTSHSEPASLPAGHDATPPEFDDDDDCEDPSERECYWCGGSGLAKDMTIW